MKLAKKQLIALFAITTMFGFFVAPQATEAKNLFQNFFRDLRSGTQFIVKLPNQTNKQIGPVLGPIVAGVLTKNLTEQNNFARLFTKIQGIDDAREDIKGQERLLEEIREMYRSQATELRLQLKKLQASREELRQQLLDANLVWDDYKVTAVELDELIKAIEITASHFDKTANELGVEDLIRVADNQLLAQVVKELEGALVYEVQSDINSLINPKLINLLVNQDQDGLDSVLDMLISGELSGSDYDSKFSTEELKKGVKEQVNQIVSENKDALQENIQAQVQQAVKNIANKMTEEAEQAGDQIQETGDTEEEAKETSRQAPPADANGCRPGYYWSDSSALGCKQSNCSEVPGAQYSGAGHCVCGSLNENSDDQSKECLRQANYSSCPGCVYACVGVNDECPR